VSSSEDWITVADVAAYLDLPGDPTSDDNLALSTAVVKAAVEGRRADLWTRDDPPVFAPPAHVKGGSVIWAGLIYQTRNAPSGFAGYGDETYMLDSLGARRAEVMRLVGWRRPELA
jgi:hypothetical protein